jgi:hypothetical protein
MADLFRSWARGDVCLDRDGRRYLAWPRADGALIGFPILHPHAPSYSPQHRSDVLISEDQHSTDCQTMNLPAENYRIRIRDAEVIDQPIKIGKCSLSLVRVIQTAIYAEISRQSDERYAPRRHNSHYENSTRLH